MREQVCLYMCPWPRIQAALTDENALNVTYHYDRGEPRMSLKKAKPRCAQGENAGDCVDCTIASTVCPTGVDIREGPNLGCIQCGLCIDACDTVMDKIGRPTRLIAYNTDVNIKRHAQGLPPVYKLIRARTVLYSAVIAAVGAVMLYALSSRADSASLAASTTATRCSCDCPTARSATATSCASPTRARRTGASGFGSRG